MERGWDPNNPTRRVVDSGACERIVVLNKRDLVPEWGMEVSTLKLDVRTGTDRTLAFPKRYGQEIS